MSAEHTRRNPDPGVVAASPPTPLTSSFLKPALLTITLITVLGALLLLARPMMAAAYLSAGARSVELARDSGEPAAALQQAAQALARAQSLDPSNPLVLRQLGALASLEGRSAEAVAFLEAALHHQPNSLILRRELAYAYIEAGRLDDAARALRELTGSDMDLVSVADLEVRAGRLDRAQSIYHRLIAAAEVAPPSILVRSALTAAALGDQAEAAQLLRASGAREPLDPILAAVVPATAEAGLLWPPELQIGNRQQELTTPSVLAFFDTGWHPYEQGFGRWVTSPAQLRVFSPDARPLKLVLMIHTLYDPTSSDFLGDVGQISVSVDGVAPVSVEAHAHQPTIVPIELPAGWSVLTVSLANGNFRPSEVMPGNGDQRDLSFVVTAVQVLP